jgi:small subunit ribosomal protein S3Ae
MATKTGKKRVARASARKVKDKWRAKQWYTVRAPRMFNGNVVAETIADEPEKLMGRVADVTLQELTGDFSKMHVKLKFKVNSVKGTDCWTKFTGHELTSDYIRRLTRRKHSKVDGVYDVKTTDGWTVRVKPLAITEKRAKSSQEGEIRVISERICKETAAQNDIAGFVKEVVNGELAQAIYKESRLVYPLKRVEIRKSEVIAEPRDLEPEVDVFPEPEKAEEEEATEEPEEVEGEAAEDLAEAVAGEMGGEATPTAEAEETVEELAEEERVEEEAPAADEESAEDEPKGT